MAIRRANPADLSRIAEIFVFNNRMNYYPIFGDAAYSFGELQVVSVIDRYLGSEEILRQIFVFDDGIIKGFAQMHKSELCKLYVDPCFQGEGIGQALLNFAVREFAADHLWVLEKNTRAIDFYQQHGFSPAGPRQIVEGTTEYEILLRR